MLISIIMKTDFKDWKARHGNLVSFKTLLYFTDIGNGMRIYYELKVWQKLWLVLRPPERRDLSPKLQSANYPTTLMKHVILSAMVLLLFVLSWLITVLLFFFLSGISIYYLLFWMILEGLFLNYKLIP